MARPRLRSDSDLIAAAARAVGRRGPQGLTLADVATEAGVSPATLVQRFGSKRGLLLAVAASGKTVVAERFADARAHHRSPARVIEHALADMASSVSDPDEVANHLAFLALDLADPEFRAHAAAHSTAMGEEIERTLRSAGVPARRRGELVQALLAAYHGTLLLWSMDRHRTAPERIRAQVRLLLRDLSKR